MGEIEGSKDIIVNELRKINKRLDRIHSWVAAFIVISVLFYLVLLGFFWLPF